jgi:hypothetical protein
MTTERLVRAVLSCNSNAFLLTIGAQAVMSAAAPSTGDSRLAVMPVGNREVISVTASM